MRGVTDRHSAIGLRGFAACVACWFLFSPRLAAQNELTGEPHSTNGAAAVAEPEVIDYTIGPGDIVAIRVWREEAVSVDGAVVRPDGKISVPLVGEVAAVDLTIPELELVLTAKFKRYINEPVVSVIVREINSRRYSVVGMVGSPGMYPLVGRMTILDGLAQAGGPSEFAKSKKIYVLRDEAGRRVMIPFNYPAVLSGKEPEQDVPLKPGDRIVVP